MQIPATLIERRGKYYCSECMMRQDLLEESYCNYCGAPFSNWEEVTMQVYLLTHSTDYENTNKLG